MPSPISAFARPQAKALLRDGEQTYLASEWGLYRLDGQTLTAIPAWHGQPVQCIARHGDGFLLLVENDQGQVLHACDASWQSVRTVLGVPGEKVKSLCATASSIFAGTKSGLFRFDGTVWARLFGDAHGRGEVLWVRSDDELCLTASVKKMGPDACPALIESIDGGRSWSVTPSPDYQDIVLAADAQWIVTRWKGARRRGERGETKKHPLSAAALWADGWAVLDGDKLETQRVGHAASSFYHPALAEAEHVRGVADRVLVAGVQGAFLVDTARGSVIDLFGSADLPGELGKIKRVFALDDGVLLATATFGTFRSTDAGATWQPVDAEWHVLDAEHVLRGANGHWWMACQRALFTSPDNGLSWRYVKLKVNEHHYSELRGGIAIVGDRLFVGTKGGLLSSPLSRPDAVGYVAGFERHAIEALHADATEGALIVGTDDGALWSHQVSDGTTYPVTRAPVNESMVAGGVDRFVLVTGDRVFDIEGPRLRDITPSEVGGDYGLARGEHGGFVLWNRAQAWRGRVGQALVPLADWPHGVRHASLCDGGHAIHTTDRRTLRRIALTPA